MTAETIQPTPTPETPLTPTPEAPPVAAEFKPDATKSEAENATAKQEWQTTQDAAKAETEKKAAETPEQKVAREKIEKEGADKAKANDTKANPFKAEEIKLPEGFTVDEPTQKEFVDLINKRGIDRETVAELVSLQAKAMKVASEAGTKLFADTQAAWQKEVASDPDIGGDKTASILASISKLVDQADDPAQLRQVMDLTGFGNNPTAIKWLNKIVPQFTEPGAVSSGLPKTPETSKAALIYDGKK